MIGLVMLIYVIIKCWYWMSSMIILRQGSFHQTRLDAGKMTTGGKAVPYKAEKLEFDLVQDVFKGR